MRGIERPKTRNDTDGPRVRAPDAAAACGFGRLPRRTSVSSVPCGGARPRFDTISGHPLSWASCDGDRGHPLRCPCNGARQRPCPPPPAFFELIGSSAELRMRHRGPHRRGLPREWRMQSVAKSGARTASGPQGERRARRSLPFCRCRRALPARLPLLSATRAPCDPPEMAATIRRRTADVHARRSEPRGNDTGHGCPTPILVHGGEVLRSLQIGRGTGRAIHIIPRGELMHPTSLPHGEAAR